MVNYSGDVSWQNRDTNDIQSNKRNWRLKTQVHINDKSGIKNATYKGEIFDLR